MQNEVPYCTGIDFVSARCIRGNLIGSPSFILNVVLYCKGIVLLIVLGIPPFCCWRMTSPGRQPPPVYQTQVAPYWTEIALLMVLGISPLYCWRMTSSGRQPPLVRDESSPILEGDSLPSYHNNYWELSPSWLVTQSVHW
jgi:hypothetical protein